MKDAPLKILALSEHFLPRVGGTANYAHQTCAALAARGHDVELLVPGPKPVAVPAIGFGRLPYKTTWLGTGYPMVGNPERSARYAFCRAADLEIRSRLQREDRRPNAIHVMFGLFLMEVIDTHRIRSAGVPISATVHNVPPMECARTWPGAPLTDRCYDRARLAAVAAKNWRRIRRSPYDLYVTPSAPVADLLKRVMWGLGRRGPIEIIPHGVNEALLSDLSPPRDRTPQGNGPLRLLTVGGWAPHKGQHLFPETLIRLREAGRSVIWEMVGPNGRVRGYRRAVLERARAVGIEVQYGSATARTQCCVQRRPAVCLRVHEVLAQHNLAECYDRAHLYVQPSTEEGFCLTALDAAAAGLPVLGSPAGALPLIAPASGGRLVPSAAKPLADAILLQASGTRSPEQKREAAERAVRIQTRFTWARAAETLETHLREISETKACSAGLTA